MKNRMDESELLTQIEHLERQATGYYSSEVQAEQAKAMNYYLGKPLGNEEEGRSSVISSDVWDAVEGMLPQILKPFVATDDCVRFNPLGPDDEAAAKQESDYVNWVVTQRNDNFNELSAFAKTGLLQKNGVAKWWWDKSRKATIERYFGLSDDEFAMMTQEPGVEVVEHTEMQGEPSIDPQTGQQVPGEPLHDVTIKTIEEIGHAAWAAIPPEEFRISRNATSPNPQRADFVQHVRKVTISELREMGYDVDDDIADESTEDPQFSEQFQARRGQEDIFSGSQEQLHPASREVLFKETFLDIDYDGDGIAELRKVCSVGKTILANEETEEKPFAAWTPYPQPFKFYGKCPGDEAIEFQDIKTTLLRQGLDNIYTINNNRVYVSGKVNLDDLIDNQIAGIVRIDGDDVGRHVVPAPITPIGQVIQPMIEYLDSAKENRLGFTRYSQGTDSDSLNKTATGIRIIKAAGDARTELISRALAEQGIANIMRGIHGLCRRHATKAETIRLRGEWVNIDPRGWKTRSDMSVAVGLGTADQQMQLQGVQMVQQAQDRMIAMGSNLVTPQNLFNANAKLVEAIGYKNPEQYFTPAEKAPPPADPTQDPHFRLEAQKVMGDLNIRQQQVAIEQFRAKVDAQAAMTPDAAAPNTEPREAAKIKSDNINKVHDRALQMQVEQLTDQRERWKALLDRDTKLEIAALQAAAAKDSGGVGADGKPEPKGPDTAELIKSFEQVIEALNSPKEVVRDASGRVTGVKHGGQVKQVIRDDSGRVTGVQ